ncbi:ABC transporter permease [Arenibacterium sp. LLYu02]|uniref:ABC transporter permease n=1 Tax=Arenibacterium sp. LLYu02 TaxID=3404132 RepID=UPI003B213FBD
MTQSVQAKARLNRIDSALAIVTALLALLLLTGWYFSDRFLTLRNFMNVLEQAAALGFASLGQALVVLVGGIDLSIGAMVTASNVLLAAVVEMNPALMVPMLVITLVFGALIGLINGFVILRSGVHPLIVTLGTASILNGAVLVYTLQPTGGVPFWFEEFAYGRLLTLPISGLVMILCFILAFGVLRYTALGRAFYAVGGHLEAANLVGLRNNRITLIAYAASGFLAALAGAYYVSRTGVGDPRVGDPITLASITPVILGGIVLGGGKGNVLGVFLGVLLMSLLANLLNYMDVSTFAQWIIQGLIIILAVAIRVGKGGRV